MRPDRDLDTPEAIDTFVRAFYREAAMDDLLGPIFEAAEIDWPRHYDTITVFWCWQLLGIKGYDGNPLRAHEPPYARTPFTSQHFARWLGIFESTVDASYRGVLADLAKARARKMANALERMLRGEYAAHDEPVEPMRVDTNFPTA